MIDHWLVDWSDGTGGTSDVVSYSYPTGADPTQPLAVTHVFSAGIASSTVTVTAVDSVNGSFDGEDQPVTVTPIAPSGVSASVSGSSIAVNWTNASSISTGTNLLLSTDDSTFFIYDQLAAGATTGTITDLNLDQPYWVEAQTIGANGVSDVTTAVSAPTSYTAPTLVVTPSDPASVGSQFTVNFSATYPDGTPESDMVAQWVVNWNDGRGPQTYNVSSGDSTTQNSDYSSTTTEATVNVTAVDGTGRSLPSITKQLFFTPPAPTDASTTLGSGDTNATINWSGIDSLNTDYVVQRMDPGSTTWTTVGTVSSTDDTSTGSNAYSYTDTTITAKDATSGSIYEVVNKDVDAPSDDSDTTGESQSSTAPVTNPPGTPTPIPSLDGEDDGLIYADGASAPGTDVTGSWSNGTGPFANGDNTTFTVAGLPTHMSFGLLVYGSVIGGLTDYPDDSITMSGPDFADQTTSEPTPDFVVGGEVADLGDLTTAQFKLVGTLDAGDYWRITSTRVYANLGNPTIDNGSVVVGGEIGIPVHFNCNDFDENEDGYSDVPITVSGLDSNVIQPLSTTVTLDSAGDGTLLVKGLKLGNSPITVTDPVGDTYTTSIGTTAPQVSSSVTSETQGATYNLSDHSVTIPGFTFSCGPSLTAVTVNYNTFRSTLPTSLMGAISGGSVIIPASEVGASVFVPMEAPDDGKIAPARVALVTLVIPGQYPYGQARISVDNPDAPAVTINGATNNAVIKVDPEGVTSKLADIHMTIPAADQTIVSTTVSWSSELVMWLTNEVGPAGTDLGSKSHGSSYTWSGRGPSDIYAQAMGGSTNWDSTQVTISVVVSKGATNAVAAASRTASNTSSGTANGAEIYYSGRAVTGIKADDMLIGQGLSVLVEWLGPINATSETSSFYWIAPGGVLNYVQNDIPAQSGYTIPIEENDKPVIAASSDSLHFYWTSKAQNGTGVGESVDCSGDIYGNSFLVQTNFDIYTPAWTFTKDGVGNPTILSDSVELDGVMSHGSDYVAVYHASVRRAGLPGTVQTTDANWSFLQVLTPNRTWDMGNAKYQLYQAGVQGLDGSVIYGFQTFNGNPDTDPSRINGGTKYFTDVPTVSESPSDIQGNALGLAHE